MTVWNQIKASVHEHLAAGDVSLSDTVYVKSTRDDGTFLKTQEGDCFC